MNRGLPLGLLMAVLTLGWVGAVPQAPAAAASTCAGVWVVVDYGPLGGISTGCATSHSNGRVALTSAGFGPTLDNGMVTRISDKPSNPDINKEYWSYWTATRKADGSYSGWSYSNLGATSSHPAKGNAEGWRYQSLSDGKVAPAASPPKAEPTPTPTPTKATPKPTPTATKKATARPTATASATRKASPSPSASPSTTARATQKAGATKSAVPASPSAPPPAPGSTPTGTDPAIAEADTAVNPAQPAPDSGSPVGAIAAAGLVAAGGAGLGGWWLLKGRRR